MKPAIIFQLSLLSFFISCFVMPCIAPPLALVVGWSMHNLLRDKEKEERERLIAELEANIEEDMESLELTDDERLQRTIDFSKMSTREIKILHRNLIQ